MSTHPHNFTRRPIGRRCAHRPALWAAVLLVLSAVGCQSIGGRGAVSEKVANCRYFTQKGVEASDRDDWAEAQSWLRRAVESCPIDIDARRYYGESLWRNGARVEAAAQLEHAIRLNPRDPLLHVRAGEMYLALGQSTRAADKAKDVLRIDPSHADGWALRARINAADGQTRAALADYHRALGYSPDQPGLLLELAELYIRTGEPQRALSTLQQLVDTYAPDEVPQRAYYVQGLAFASLERFDDAADSHRAAARCGPADAEILYRLAEAEMLAHRPQAARWAAHDALSVEPRHEPSRRLLARIELASRAPEGRGL
ncbi:MAG: tetratricopeptide repeat protein [Planctomycetes bacterium]|nr:tetratricopeptide repeat protein [Planctomycetota bacterium]